MFDLFSIGIGPSSSHTVGPMRAAHRFAASLAAGSQLDQVTRVRAELFGSLGATGHGHGSENAVLYGLEGQDCETIDTAAGPVRAAQIRTEGRLLLNGTHPISFDPDADLILHRRKSLPGHPNGMTFTAFGDDPAGPPPVSSTYYSVGGGFVLGDDGFGHPALKPDPTPVPYPFSSAAELLAHCERRQASISEIMLANECARRPEAEVRAGLLKIWAVMVRCVEQGCATPGVLPGGLKVRRRAAELNVSLIADRGRFRDQVDPLSAMDWSPCGRLR